MNERFSIHEENHQVPLFLQSNIVSKCINLLENFPIRNVVNYLYCNDLFMFSIQDFVHGHKPLSYSLRMHYISIHNN